VAAPAGHDGAAVVAGPHPQPLITGEWVKSVVTMLTAVVWARDLAGREVGRLHAHWATHPALAAYVLSHLLDVPYGFTAHAHDLYNENGMLEEKLRRADLAVTISSYNVDLLRSRFGHLADDVVLLHCGVDREAFRPTPGRPGRLRPLRLLTVASLSEYKGHRYLLDAVALLERSGQPVDCSLVGDGPLRDTLQRQRDDLGLHSSVTFLGRRTAPEVRRLMQECDVFVLPSVRTADGMMEGIPVALMEALASGRPSVASRLSGIPELVEDGLSGLLVPPADADALADALARLADDEDLRRTLAEAGPRRIADGFDQRVNVERLRSIFLERGQAGT
jgi:glycosyltransferase involved in cell wall biosynthesis